MNEIITSSIWKLFGWLPGFILKRIYPPRRFSELIVIDVRPRHDPVQLNFGEIPHVDVWLQITNRSPFQVELDRVHVVVHYGVGTTDLYNLERVKFGSNTSQDIYVRGFLTDSYAISGSNQPDDVECSILVSAEFNSRITNFGKRTGELRGIKPRVINKRAR